jgi:hypothetical protein
MNAKNELRHPKIDEAKRLLPMPDLMKQLELGAHVNTHADAQCPLCHREDSFTIRENSDGTWWWRCESGCGEGDEITFLEEHLKLKRVGAAIRYLQMAGVIDGAPKPKQALTHTVQSGNGATNVKPAEPSSAPPTKPRPLEGLLGAICALLQRYVVFQFPEQPVVIALWIVHTWTIKAFDYTAYLFVNSAEKRSGKTRLLDVLALVVKGPWRAAGASEAVLFRKVERDKPTLLYDEIDTVFHANKNDGMENIRRFFNVGYERGAKIPRCVGEGAKQDIQEFDPFCAKAISGIGKVLPDTVTDRCLPIELQRQSREEKAERFRKREAEALAAPIRGALEAFWQQTGLTETLRDARPSLPDELSDRQQDICEPLLAIAEMANGEWAQNARAALVKLCAQEEDASIRVKLLGDIKTVFDTRSADRLTTEAILEALVRIEDSPWALMWADDLKFSNIQKAASKLARMLKDYRRPDGERLKPRTVRIGNQTPKGFHRGDFEEAWKRYLPSASEKAATSATSATHDRGNVAAVAAVAPFRDDDAGFDL